MHCTLLVPDLLLSSPPDAALYRDLQLPVLTRLLARGRCSKLDPVSMEAWLCQAFKVERQRDWPVAPLTLIIDGGDPGENYWLRCDPVHLRAQRSQLLLADSGMIAPSQDEAHALVAALNSHFTQDGLVFQAPRPERWYLRLTHAPELATSELPEVAGKDIDRYLPTGNDSLQWHQRLNEIQMLLHAHPVNQAREARNQPTINSVWPWGGGVKPVLQGRQFSGIWSDDVLALALAVTSGIPTHAMSNSPAPLLAAADTDKQLAVLSQLRTAVGRGDFEGWCTGLTALERDWFGPLLDALRQRRLSALTLIAPSAERCLRCDISNSDLWKFWRPLRSLAHHA